MVVVICLAAGIVLAPLLYFIPLGITAGNTLLAAGVVACWAAVWITTRSARAQKKWSNALWVLATALLLLCLFTACSLEGPAGPAGPPGKDGAPGVAGKDGQTLSRAVSGTLPPADGGGAPTSWDIALPGITAPVVVSVYLRESSDFVWFPTWDYFVLPDGSVRLLNISGDLTGNQYFIAYMP